MDSTDTKKIEDEEFIRRFETCTLDSFGHVDHIRVAYMYATRGGAAEAVRGAMQIRRFAEAAGAAGKFHTTMTVAWARVIAHLVDGSAAADFDSFLAAHPMLLNRRLLAAHYSDAVMFSAEARAGFVEPDRLALP
jgi:hypothetical protein